MGQGVHHLAGADAGRRARRAARRGRHGDGRHRPLPVGHGHVRLDDHALLRPAAARRGRRGAGGPDRAGGRAARRAARAAGGGGRRRQRRRSAGALGVTYAELAQGKRIARRLDGEAALEAVRTSTSSASPRPAHDARGEGHRRGAVRRRHPPAGHAVRPDPAAAGARRDAARGGRLRGRGGGRRRPWSATATWSPCCTRLPTAPSAALAAGAGELGQPGGRPRRRTRSSTTCWRWRPAGRGRRPRRRPRGGPRRPRRTVERTYLDGYVAHAPMETHTAVAEFEDGKVHDLGLDPDAVPAQTQVARGARPGRGRVRVITPFVGGGFGGKSDNQQAIEAARLAKLAGPPGAGGLDARRGVLLRHVPAGGGGQDRRRRRRRAAASPSGTTHVYFAGERGAEQFYDIPHHRTVASRPRLARRPGHPPLRHRRLARARPTTPTPSPASRRSTSWRPRPGSTRSSSAWRNLADARDAARPAKRPPSASAGSPRRRPAAAAGASPAASTPAPTSASLAEVAVDRRAGEVQVKRVVCAQDMGLVHQPRGRRHPDGGLHHHGPRLRAHRGGPLRGRQDPRHATSTPTRSRASPGCPRSRPCSSTPPDDPPQGGGEPAIIVMGAVVANAIFDAVGARVLRLPMTADRVKAAMPKV